MGKSRSAAPPRPRPPSRSCGRRAALALGAALLALGTRGAVSPAHARELFWRSIAVVAHVEADGSISVAETQAMVMSGDWNGGERIFRVETGQNVAVRRIVRVDPGSGGETVLERGDLDQVDRWNWNGRTTVRWRSRLPSDPPYERTLLVYRLETTAERIFEKGEGELYCFAHDFAFADREGPIERFALELSAAPGWSVASGVDPSGRRSPGALPARFEAGPLEPGRGFVVEGCLAWAGAGAPARATPRRLDPEIRSTVATFVAASALFFAWTWWRRDAALGRFVPLEDEGKIDAAWLEKRLLAQRPEVVGAAWDRSIGSAEVAAILARLVAEGRIASRVERVAFGPFGRDVLHLELLVPRDRFDADEKSLIAGLFPVGDRIDTDGLRRHYRSRGFDPVSKIRSRLDQRVKSLTGFRSGSPRPKRRPTVLLLLAGVALVAATPFLATGGELAFLAIAGVLLASIPGFVAAGVARSKLGVPRGALFAISISSVLAALVVRQIGVVAPIATATLGAALFAAGLLRGIFQTLSTPESAESMATRRDLAAARRWLRTELRRQEPRLDDRWFPWLVGLGLAPECDRWARRFGVEGTTGVASASRGSWGSSSPGSGGIGAGGWSGGGGSFGGAGATASFASAVSTMAAGVPAPSSSGGSGGGGGGGGGSSSGGGGGGGW